MAPTKVRMIGQCGKSLDQSLRQHGARVQALMFAVWEVDPGKGSTHPEEVAAFAHAYTRVLEPHIASVVARA